jgi:hypothetical protein
LLARCNVPDVDWRHITILLINCIQANAFLFKEIKSRFQRRTHAGIQWSWQFHSGLLAASLFSLSDRTFICRLAERVHIK